MLVKIYVTGTMPIINIFTWKRAVILSITAPMSNELFTCSEHHSYSAELISVLLMPYGNFQADAFHHL